LYVRAYFSTAQLAGLKTGDKVKVIPDDGSLKPQAYEGTVTWISEEAEFTPKNIQTRDERAEMVYAVKVAVPKGTPVRLGMYAYIQL
ncbi:MAG: HlyD family efflux transporter periplasmic adaptor subunit, partial [Bacteroidetes bacterium]|nr:HlyD family efflux transporter periplasmic adaptor subunit [Candidatus Cryptobacteroides intestinigallinarum]